METFIAHNVLSPYRDVVLRLEVIPLINSPEEITLTIEAELVRQTPD
mgnify:CR=1 FL=1